MTQEINNECWRNISGYLKYQVSNVGRVRNSITGRILKPQIRKDVYYQICLCENSMKTRYLIHRLVAREFSENPDNKNFVDHMNHNKADNTILNLRWVSNAENDMNRTKRQNTSSRFKGVWFNKQRNNWRAQIMLDGKNENAWKFRR